MTVSVKAPTSTTGSIQLNGSDVINIDSSGNIGIGTSSPSNKLDVNGGTRFATSQWVQFGTNNTFYADASYGLIVKAPATSNFIAFRDSSDTERMRIDGSGYVTEPNKPMAFAVSAPATGTSPGSPIVLKYANAAYNPGSHYNSTTGLFTCPVAGRYKVTQHCMVDAALTSYPLNVSINKNGGGVTTGYTQNVGYNACVCMAIISCAANDTLSATLNHGGKHAGYDSFTVEFLG